MTTPPPQQLSKLRCARHPDREAAARCASCGLVFCRECASEHNGRLLCAPCLEKTAAAERAAAARRPRAATALLKRALATAAGAAWLWLCLYLTGLLIEKLPQSFHEGTIWRMDENTASDAVAQTARENPKSRNPKSQKNPKSQNSKISKGEATPRQQTWQSVLHQQGASLARFEISGFEISGFFWDGARQRGDGIAEGDGLKRSGRLVLPGCPHSGRAGQHLGFRDLGFFPTEDTP